MRRLPVASSRSSVPLEAADSDRCKSTGLGAARPHRRAFGPDMLQVLTNVSELREASLLALSNERFVEATSYGSEGERARLAAFESAYLALASMVPGAGRVDIPHPCRSLVADAVRRLSLTADDSFLAVQMAALYTAPSWESLNHEAIVEWCHRVRLAVADQAGVGRCGG